MGATIDVKCPYCGTTQRVLLHVREWPDSASRPECVLCDNEIGGCDKWFVASVVTHYTVTTATISSEDEHEVWIPQAEAVAVLKPLWGDAPEWAQWWAVDQDEFAYWYESKPRNAQICWRAQLGTQTRCAGVVDLDGGHWYRSLVQRPQAVQP